MCTILRIDSTCSSFCAEKKIVIKTTKNKIQKKIHVPHSPPPPPLPKYLPSQHFIPHLTRDTIHWCHWGCDVFGMSMDKKREISSFQTEKKMGLFYKLMFFMKDLQKTTLCGMPCIKWSDERTGAVK